MRLLALPQINWRDVGAYHGDTDRLPPARDALGGGPEPHRGRDRDAHRVAPAVEGQVGLDLGLGVGEKGDGEGRPGREEGGGGEEDHWGWKESRALDRPSPVPPQPGF